MYLLSDDNEADYMLTRGAHATPGRCFLHMNNFSLQQHDVESHTSGCLHGQAQLTLTQICGCGALGEKDR
jgi:hypothetical protein